MKIEETRNPELMGKLAKVMQETHRNLYPKFFKPYDQAAFTEQFRKAFDNPKQQVFLWRDEQKENAVAAYLWLEEQEVKATASRYGYKRLYLSHVLVMPDYQGAGLGKELLNFADKTAKERGIHTVELHYWPENNIPKKMYQKYGFTVYTEIAYKQV